MNYRAKILVALLIPMLLAADAAPPRDGQSLVGTKMPDLAFDRWIGTDGGKPLDVSGRPVLYRWWTAGCSFCTKTLPSIETLRTRHEADGLRVVAVFHPKPVREVAVDKIQDAAKQNGYSGVIAADDSWSQLNRVWLSEGRPATSVSILVDAKGVIRYVHPGTTYFPSDDPEYAKENKAFRELEAMVATVLAEAKQNGRATQPAGWKAGVAAVRITPDKPLVLLGYPDRAGPFTKVSQDIWAKAIAIEDPAGHRAVIVTGDLVGFQAANTTNPVCERLEQITGLPRERFIFNASHTHTGPVVSQKPQRTYNVGHPAMTDVDAAQTAAYTKSLQDKLTSVCVEALGKLAPAELSWGKGEVKFPMSRRMPTPNGVIMANNPSGITDHDAPVLRVNDAEGKPIAILFGAACHNVAAGGINEIHGDYAGVAQLELQNAYPGAVAMFMAGCGADVNPVMYGSLALAERHGKELATEVQRILGGELKPIDGKLTTQFSQSPFPLQQLSREQIDAYTKLPNFQARQAKHMLEILDGGGELLKTYDAPISVWQFGDALTLVALPGEPVAEYVPLLRKSLGEKNLWIAGFNNDCFGYLPTASVIKEGGHEAIGITLWAWGQDLDRYVAFFAPEVQDHVVKTAMELAKKAGRKP
jgi:neutral ceramidase